MTVQAKTEEIAQLKWMRRVSAPEGTTLLLLVLVAVPIKYLAGFPIATRIVGPVHGIAFLFYIWTLRVTVSRLRSSHAPMSFPLIRDNSDSSSAVSMESRVFFAASTKCRVVGLSPTLNRSIALGRFLRSNGSYSSGLQSG